MARSFLYMPPGLEKFITSDIVYKMRDDRLVTEMSKGEHMRDAGVPSIKIIECSFALEEEEYSTWQQFFRVARGRSFWMPFPNPKDPTIDPEKYYLFVFAKVEEFTEQNSLKVIIPAKLNWHYMVPPREYGDQSL